MNPIRLLESLPEAVTVDGRDYPVFTDYRAWMHFEEEINRKDLSELERARKAFVWYPNFDHPEDIGKAIEGVFWFHRCGKKLKESDDAHTQREPTEVINYAQDADMIFAAFWQVYRIDLQATNLHWWKFCALLNGLPEGCMLSTAMSVRAANMADVPKYDRKRIQKLKQTFALDAKDGGRKLSLEERNAQMFAKAREARERAAMAKMSTLQKPNDNE